MSTSDDGFRARFVAKRRALLAITAAFVGVMLGLGAFADANVPVGSETSGNSSTWVLTDSVRPGGPVPNALAYGFTPASNLNITGDDQTAAVPDGIPFAFTLEGESFAAATPLTVSANGLIVLGTAVPGFTNTDLAATATTAALIAPFWDDLSPNICSDGIFANTFGATPNRVLVVEWRNVCDFGAATSDGFTFQARLFETSNAVEFHYSDVEGAGNSNNGVSATVGIKATGENNPGSNAAYLQYSFDTTTPASPIDSGGFAIRFNSCPTRTPTVTSAAALDAAISCYNQQQPAGNHIITLGADFSHPFFTPSISQSDTSISLLITSDVTHRTITGPGAGSIIGLEFDLFAVTGAGPVTFDDLTLAGADDDTIQYNSGTNVTITNTTIKDGQYGLSADGGTMTVSNSTITNNVNDGIFNNGTVSVSNSTIINNTRHGINNNGTVSVSNSTITNNTNNGIDNAGTVVVVSSIVANNSNSDCAGTVSGGNNFDSDDSCAEFSTLAPVGAGSLGALTNNGGPTQTQELLAASNAVDAGKCTDVVVGLNPSGNNIIGDLTLDQRGTEFPRTLGADCDAGAFEAVPGPCATATTTPIVSDAAELDTAIGCYNAQTPPGNHTITLDASFSHPDPTPAVTQSDPSFSLTITSDATHRTITGPGSDGAGDLITLSSPGGATINKITLTNAAEDAITATSGVVVIDATTVTASQGTGIVVDGARVTVSNSTMNSNTNAGIVRVSGWVAVSNSTISGNGTSGVFGSAVHIANSTITNNSTGLAGSTPVVQSSIIADNTTDCSGSLTDQGSNFDSDGTCSGFTMLTPAGAGSLAPLAPNGGPTQTHALLAGSNAIGGGDCTNVTVSVDTSGTFQTGNLEFDQRGVGFARTLGAECDAGAFETNPCATATLAPIVSDAAELDTAIGCYNAQTPAGSHTITLDADFSHPGGTPTISQSDSSFSLLITSDATHRTITGPGAASVAGPIDLFVVSGAGPVTFDDLTLAGADDDTIQANNGTNVTLTNSTITNSTYGIYANGGTVTVSNSTITNNAQDGIDNFGTVSVSNSTITNNAQDGIDNFGIVTVSNSTITNNTNAGISNGGTVSVSNSTITNNPKNGISNGGTMSVVSSIVANNTGADCSGTDPEGGNSFDSDDSCAGFSTLAPIGAGSLGALTNNGGPTETQELLAGSNAVDAGKCTGVVVGVDSSGSKYIVGDLEFDQRGVGFDRSIGICDAGAFEADTFVRFNPLTPSRILDTRPGFASAGNLADGPDTPIGAGDANVRTVKVADLAVAGVPANATAVAIHVTSVSPTANSFLTVWPTGARPNAASKNFGITAGGPFGYAGLTNDLLIVPVGPGGTVQIYNDAGTVDLVIDVVGYYAPTGDPYKPLFPSRILDTRPGQASAGNPADGPDTPVGAGDLNVRTVKVADLALAGVPANATAVAIHVTSVSPTANSFLTVWPNGARPNAASKNFGITAGGPFGYAGLTNDLLIVPVGPGGTVQIYNDAGTVDLVIDVVGYYAPTGDPYKPLFPSRILDTRPGFDSAGNPADGPNTPISAGDLNVRTITVADLALAGVPANATAVAIHVTSVSPTANTFLTVWPNNTRPNAASKNFGITAGGPFGYAGLTNDLLIVPVGPAGTIQIYNDAGTVDLVIDIVGYTTSTG